MKNMSAWAIRHPGDAGGAVRRAVLHGRGRLHPAAHQPEPGHLLPVRDRRRLAAGRRAAGDRDADHPEGRGRGREHRRREAHPVHGDGRPGATSASSSRSARRSIARSPTCAMPSRRFAATCRKASRSRMVQRIDIDGGAIVYYARQHHGDDGRRALLVRRQHRHASACSSVPAWRRFSAAAA